MILLVDSSAPCCHLKLIDDSTVYDGSWEAGRSLAADLLTKINSLLVEADASWTDISGIGAFRGPGSFTGLRIGLTVVNTIADSQSIPIVGVSGDDWRETAIENLKAGQNDKLVMPEYGGQANITQPRK